MVLLVQGQKAAEGSQQVRQAKKNERNMGLTFRSYYQDEITGEDRYQTKFSWGIDSRTARLEPSGSAYKLSPSWKKMMATSGVSLVAALAGGLIAVNGVRNKSYKQATVGALATAISLAMVVPKTIDWN
jgi:hypothetical protein